MCNALPMSFLPLCFSSPALSFWGGWGWFLAISCSTRENRSSAANPEGGGGFVGDSGIWGVAGGTWVMMVCDERVADPLGIWRGGEWGLSIEFEWV